MLQSEPLNTNEMLPNGTLIVPVPASTFCAVPCIVIGALAAFTVQSFITYSVPNMPGGNVIVTGAIVSTHKK
jgi:hypothetical protein